MHANSLIWKTVENTKIFFNSVPQAHFERMTEPKYTYLVYHSFIN